MVVVNDQIITLDLSNAICQRRSLSHATGVSVVVIIPSPLVQSVADMKGLSLDQFCQEWEAEFRFGGFEGAYLRFVPRRKDQEPDKTGA